MTKIFTREQLETKGWNDEKIKFFLGKPFTEKDQEGWSKRQVKKAEGLQEYINFEGIEIYLERQKNLDTAQIDRTLKAIQILKNNTPHKNNHNCLLNNIENYKNESRLINEIIHYPEGELFDKETSFKLFTDGCLKVVGDKTFVSCAGWIQNASGKIVTEFAKEIYPDNIKNAYNFEIYAIALGMEIVNKLNLKNVECFTDSSGEAKILSYAMAGFTPNRVLENPKTYKPILENLKAASATISYIPREYNTHADELTKVHLDYYKNLERKEIQKQKKDFIDKGFDYTVKEGKSYFIHNSLNLNNDFEKIRNKTKWYFYPQYNPNSKTYYNFLINTENKEFHIISKLHKSEIFKEYDKMGLSSEKLEIKKSKSDSALIMNLSYNLDILSDYKKIGISTLSPGFNVVLENTIPIPEKLKDEYFELHKKMNKFQNLFLAPIPVELKNKINNFINNEIISKEEIKHQKMAI